MPFLIRRSGEKSDPNRILLLLHGYLGNESLMWPLTKPLPDTYTLLAPRAPIQMGPDQYCWHKITPQWPELTRYQNMTDGLLARVKDWSEKNKLKISRVDVMGFSQGAVMAYALSLLHPQTTGKAAALAGFIPQIWMRTSDSLDLSDREFFIAHGTRDEMIPIQKAHRTAAWLRDKGAQVVFCESDTGHKLSVECMGKLGKFFR